MTHKSIRLITFFFNRRYIFHEESRSKLLCNHIDFGFASP